MKVPEKKYSTGVRSLSAACLTVILLLFLFSCLVEQEQAVLDGQDIRLTILHTSDIHSRLLPYDLEPLTSDINLGLSPLAAPYGGVARIAAIIERERERSQRVLYFDSGDIFQGAPIFNENHGEVEIQWLSMMRPDAVVIGNHEFDEGSWNLFDQLARHGTFPILAANYKFRNPKDPSVAPLAHLVYPYTIQNVDGIKVGIIGMGSITSMYSIVAEGNRIYAVPLEQNELLRSYVDYLSPQVDIVSVVSHLGLNEDANLVHGYERAFRKSDVEHLVSREYDTWTLVEDYNPHDPDGMARFRVPGVRGLDFIMGGHLHVVLNPPQVLTDPDGRSVILSHPGAFSKYVGRLDLILEKKDEPAHGWRIKTHKYRAIPVDSAWCREVRREYDNSEEYRNWVEQAIEDCAGQEHVPTLNLLKPYILGLNQSLDLPRIFAWAPMTVQRRSQSGGGDAPLGNLTSESMRTRRGVEAEICITNTLGMRDAVYAGPVNMESMFNVFPFENTITLMYLSGSELQETLNFVTNRSSDRGCQSQIQIAGMSFIMDCGQVRANRQRYPCSVPSDCPNYSRDGSDGIAWDCQSNVCWTDPARNILVNGEPLDPTWSYRVATNDYIAKGGSGFRAFARNTTQIDTGISIREALIDSMRNYCNCYEILARAPSGLSDDEHFLCNGQPVDLRAVKACDNIRNNPGSAPAGRCNCRQIDEAINSGHVNSGPCGRITPAMKDFCEDPMIVPLLMGYEDNRISRRVVDRSQEGL